MSKILIAEDDIPINNLVKKNLTLVGHDCKQAYDGQQAVETFRAAAPGTFGVILMDLLMPRMDGCAAARAIRALPRPDAKTVRIIACTANSFAEDRTQALKAGMDDFVAKPVDLEDLLRKLTP